MKQPRCEGSGKAIFSTERDALQIAASVKFNASKKSRQKHRQGAPKQCRAYVCEYCGLWHLTSLPEYKAAIPVKDKPLKYYNQFKKFM